MAIHGFNLFNPLPGLSAKGACIHGQGATHGAGDPGQKLHTTQPFLGGAARHPGTTHTRLNPQQPLGLERDFIQAALERHHGAVKTAIAHQQVAPHPQP